MIRVARTDSTGAAKESVARPQRILRYLPRWLKSGYQVGKSRKESVTDRCPASSSDIQARGHSPPRQLVRHSLKRVVFPKPAGAQMRISLRPVPCLSRSARRGRGTTLGCTCGAYSSSRGRHLIPVRGARKWESKPCPESARHREDHRPQPERGDGHHLQTDRHGLQEGPRTADPTSPARRAPVSPMLPLRRTTRERGERTCAR